MLDISQKAADKILAINQNEPSKPIQTPTIRVSVVSGGCSGLSYKMDFEANPTPNDQIFEVKNIKMVVDKKSFFYLIGTQLEYTDGLQGKGFHFVNPNASRTCACGESFSL